MKISDYEINVRLPASEDCYGIKVLSREERRLPAAECTALMYRAIFMTSENWALIRGDIQQNCQTSECTQLTGRFDNLFMAIDKGLQKVP